MGTIGSFNKYWGWRPMKRNYQRRDQIKGGHAQIPIKTTLYKRTSGDTECSYKTMPISHRFGKCNLYNTAHVWQLHQAKGKPSKTVPGAILGACPKAANGRFYFILFSRTLNNDSQGWAAFGFAQMVSNTRQAKQLFSSIRSSLCLLVPRICRPSLPTGLASRVSCSHHLNI